MKVLCRSIFLFVAFTSSVLAAEPAALDAVRQADRQRIEATIAGDTLKLNELLSDELTYAHSDGRVQTKAQFIAAVAGNSVRYLSVQPSDVALRPIGDAGALMQGRARLTAEAAGRRVEFTLRFLAVWRLEDGRWRLLAYQSAPLAPEAAAPR